MLCHHRVIPADMRPPQVPLGMLRDAASNGRATLSSLIRGCREITLNTGAGAGGIPCD